MKDFLIDVYGWLLILLVLYIGGWVMFLKPLIDLIFCETLTGGFLATVILKMIFAMPVANLINKIGIVLAVKILMR